MSIFTMVLLGGCSLLEFVAPSPPAPAPEVLQAPAEPASPPSIDLAVPRSVSGMAARLVELERAIRDPEVPLSRVPALGHAQQRLLRALATDAVAAAAVLAALPDDLRPPVQAMLDATAAVAHTVKDPKTDLPGWRIVPAESPAELLVNYKEAEDAHGVPWSILAAIHLNETRMGRLRGTSIAGAQGPMQFMPKTWAEYGTGDVNNNRDAILAAGRYVAASGWAEDPDKAIWAYNHSNNYVKAIRAFGGLMADEPRLFHALWGWQVYYRTVQGAIWLEEGYDHTERTPIATYCSPRGEPHCPAIHPE